MNKKAQAAKTFTWKQGTIFTCQITKDENVIVPTQCWPQGGETALWALQLMVSLQIFPADSMAIESIQNARVLQHSNATSQNRASGGAAPVGKDVSPQNVGNNPNAQQWGTG